MYVTTYFEEGEHHHNREPHLVFVLADAESHGLGRIKPEPYTCECGAELTPETLDAGDGGKLRGRTVSRGATVDRSAVRSAVSTRLSVGSNIFERVAIALLRRVKSSR